jgi:predicted transcriptional regulator
MTETVSGRLPDDVVEALDALGRATGRSRSEVLRDVVRRGVAAERLANGIEAYRTRSASLGKAAALAGVPLGAFLDELRRAGLLRDYDQPDLQDDLAWAAKP